MPALTPSAAAAGSRPNTGPTMSTLTKKRVVTADIDAAVAEVQTAGVTEASLRPLVDAFVAANARGAITGAAREAFTTGLATLVAQLPKTPALVRVRQDEAALAASLKDAKALVTTQTARIASLETEVATAASTLAEKAKTTRSLLEDKTSLQTALTAHKEKEKDSALISILAAMLLGSSSGSVAGAASTAFTIKGVQTTIKVGDLSKEIAALDTEIRQTKWTMADLDARMGRAQTILQGQRDSLDGLKLVERSLRDAVAATTTTAARTTYSEKLNGMVLSLEAHQALSRNLGEQIGVLETMKASLTHDDAVLTNVIDQLKAQNADLQGAIAASARRLKSGFIDLVLEMSGVARQINVGELTVPTKTLLLDGVEGLRLSVLAQVKGFADELLATRLAGTSSQTPAGQMFLSALSGDAAGAIAIASGMANDAIDRATLEAIATLGFDGPGASVVLAGLKGDVDGMRAITLGTIVDNLKGLTPPQRLVVEHLLFGPASAPTQSADTILGIAERVVAESTLTEARARTIVSTLTTTTDLATTTDPLLNGNEALVTLQATPATSSSITLKGLADNGVDRLMTFDQLGKLRLEGASDVNEANFARIATLPLRTANLAEMTGGQLRALSGSKHLETLTLVNYEGDEDALASLEAASALRELKFFSRPLGQTGLDALGRLASLETLMVALAVPGSALAKAGLSAVKRLEVELGEAQSAADLQSLASLPGLTRLTLEHRVDTPADVAPLLASSSLEHLRVSVKGPGASFPQPPAASGRATGTVPSMTVALDLEGPQSRADLEAIAKLPGLSTLDLDGATFDPADLVVLAASPTLSHVWVDTQVPQAALDAFVAAPGRSRTCRSF